MGEFKIQNETKNLKSDSQIQNLRQLNKFPLYDAEFPECITYNVQSEQPTIKNSLATNNNATHDTMLFHQKF